VLLTPTSCLEAIRPPRVMGINSHTFIMAQRALTNANDMLALPPNDRARKGANDLISKTVIEANRSQVVLPDVKVGDLSEGGDPVINGADQGVGIPSSLVARVRTHGAYFSIAGHGGTLTRHGNQAALIANAPVTSELNRALPKGSRFGESSEGQHFRYVMFTKVLDRDIPGWQAVSRPAKHLLDGKLHREPQPGYRVGWLIQEESAVSAWRDQTFERLPTFWRWFEDSCQRTDVFRIPLCEAIALGKIRVACRKRMPYRVG